MIKFHPNSKNLEYPDVVYPSLISRVYLPVAANNLERSVVSAQGDVKPDKRLTGLNQIKVWLVDTGLTGSFLEIELHLFQETRLVIRVELGSELFLAGNNLGGELAVGHHS